MKKNIGNENHIIDDIISRREHYFWTIFIAILICLGLWVGGMFLTHWYAQKYFCISGGEGDSRALFGDSFGAVNALISAFAFAGVIVSMYLQRKDLALQRKSLDIQKYELTRNTEELFLQRKEFETQNMTMKLQRFENTFFNMMSLQQEIISSIKYIDGAGQPFFGRGAFSAIYNNLIANPFGPYPEYYRCFLEYAEEQNYNTIINLNGFHSFNHYFTHFYHILKFIDSTKLLESKHERYFYARILRSTLSKHELYLIYFNCLIFDELKKLVEEYTILKYVPDYFLLDNEYIEYVNKLNKLFHKSAFNPNIKGYNIPYNKTFLNHNPQCPLSHSSKSP